MQLTTSLSEVYGSLSSPSFIIYMPPVYATRPSLILLHLKLHTKLLHLFFWCIWIAASSISALLVTLNLGLIGPLKLSDKPQLSSSSSCFGKLARPQCQSPLPTSWIQGFQLMIWSNWFLLWSAQQICFWNAQSGERVTQMLCKEKHAFK
jgi:hypothetical protein